MRREAWPQGMAPSASRPLSGQRKAIAQGSAGILIAKKRTLTVDATDMSVCSPLSGLARRGLPFTPRQKMHQQPRDEDGGQENL